MLKARGKISLFASTWHAPLICRTANKASLPLSNKFHFLFVSSFLALFFLFDAPCVMNVKTFCFSFTIKSVTVVNFNAFRKFSSDWGIFIVIYEVDEKKSSIDGFLCATFSWLDFVCCGLIWGCLGEFYGGNDENLVSFYMHF